MRHVALPAEHGAWVLLLGPLAVGLCAGGRLSGDSLLVSLAALAAFLVRQPLTLAVKALGGRRGREVLPAATLWIGVWGALGLAAAVWLALRGFGRVLLLALPGVPVLAWHLGLVFRRDERRQWGVEVLAAGSLALAAPAAQWVGAGRPDPSDWVLWVLMWAQSAASITHAYLRLEQRGLGRPPSPAERRRMARPALGLTTFNLVGSGVLGVATSVSPWIALAFLVQWGDTLWCATHPAVGVKPRSIGYRQLATSVLFFVVFVVAWGR